MKKEMDRYTSKNNVTAYSNLIIICRSEIDTAQQSRLMTAEERKKEKFDSLPEWKKKLILQKQSKLTHSQLMHFIVHCHYHYSELVNLGIKLKLNTSLEAILTGPIRVATIEPQELNRLQASHRPLCFYRGCDFSYRGAWLTRLRQTQVHSCGFCFGLRTIFVKSSCVMTCQLCNYSYKTFLEKAFMILIHDTSWLENH